MNERARELFEDRESSDGDIAYQALLELFKMTDEPVDWAYEHWDALLEQLTDGEGSKRAFAAQMLERLAISDPDGRMMKDFPRVAAVMKDEKTVTARHTLQSIWRVGLAGSEQREMVIAALEQRYRECEGEKNAKLWRSDAVTALGRLAKETRDDSIEARVDALIESEDDPKQSSKQRAAWRKAVK